MFILTTASRISQTEIQKTQAFAITQRTLTTLLNRDRGQAATSSAQASSVL